MIHILVLLEVKDRKSFLEFETQAVQIMKKHGGRVTNAFIPSAAESSDDKVGEIHYLEFPSLAAFNKYRSDSELLKLKALRTKAIIDARVYVSETLVDYTGSAG